MARSTWQAWISIHSPHTRGDLFRELKAIIEQPISIHSPHTRGDSSAFSCASRMIYFNPLPSHEGRRAGGIAQAVLVGISIHSPHTRGDQGLPVYLLQIEHFNPLPSHEGRLAALGVRVWIGNISIHSPHTRGDKDEDNERGLNYISIHSPHTRGDMAHRAMIAPGRRFQSTPLTRGETLTAKKRSCATRTFQSTPLTRGETTPQRASSARN